MVARPGPALASVQELMEDESIQALQDDRMFWVLVENGAGERAINQLSFYSIVHDPEIRERLADLGFISRVDYKFFVSTLGHTWRWGGDNFFSRIRVAGRYRCY